MQNDEDSCLKQILYKICIRDYKHFVIRSHIWYMIVLLENSTCKTIVIVFYIELCMYKVHVIVYSYVCIKSNSNIEI